MIAKHRFADPSHDQCNHALLKRLVHDQLTADELTWTSQHLNHCDKCRQLLDDDSRSDADWQSSIESVRMSLTATASATTDENNGERSGVVPAGNSLPASLVSWLKPVGPDQHQPDTIGLIDRFLVKRIVGAGGMGIVMEGWDAQLHRPIAIKAMHPHLAAIGIARQRFIREARAAAAVVHPNVVPIHSVYAEHDPPFLIMPLIAGESLQERIDRDGAMEIDAVLRVASQVADGLAAAHRQGLVHRDIKPANILVEHGTERAMITDFGVVRALDEATVTGSGAIAGTPEYMSPEQARGEAIDHRSDLFSLGSVIYAMLVGRSAFRADTPFAALRRLSEDTPRSIHETHPHVPNWLVALVEKLHAKSAAQRVQSGDELALWLREALSHWQDPKRHALPDALIELVEHNSIRKVHWLVAGVGVLVFALVGMTLWLSPPVVNESAPIPPQPPPIVKPVAPIDIEWALEDIDREITALEAELKL